MNRTFDLGLNAATITTTALWVGRVQVPWDRILGVGVSYQSNGRYVGGQTAILHLAYAPMEAPGSKKEMIIYLQAPVESDNGAFVGEVRARVGARWLGEAGYFEMRKRLGFSNQLLFGVVAAIVGITLLVVIGIAVAVNLGKSSSRSRSPANRESSQQPAPSQPAQPSQPSRGRR